MSNPDLNLLFNSLPQKIELPPYSLIPADEVPEPYHQLLVHDRHMTVAMETYHHCKVRVRVLQRQHDKDWYARQILLLPVTSDKVVLAGIVRIHLHMLDPEVQTAILREDTPLGHVLINHDVMRHIEVTNYVRFESFNNWPGFKQDTTVYGRLGFLYCDQQPAIELFEVIPSV